MTELIYTIILFCSEFGKRNMQPWFSMKTEIQFLSSMYNISCSKKQNSSKTLDGVIS